MNQPTEAGSLSVGQAMRGKLEELKRQAIDLYQIIPGLTECTRLSDLLQKLHELRVGINQLELGLLEHHLSCCISPRIKIPGEVVVALSNLRAQRQGAIIVIEQENSVDEHLQGGVTISALVSAAILENIFYPGTPLHDGAAVIRNDQIVKAGCILPLAHSTQQLKALGLGTRHRAALGLSQLTDALIIVASEEKGWISVALRGQFYPNLGTQALLEKLGGNS